jgi:hypothetical protein
MQVFPPPEENWFLEVEQMHDQLRRRISLLLAAFTVGLVISGLTAFPLKWEVDTLARLLGAPGNGDSGLLIWIDRVRQGLTDTYARYPFMGYGTDWLAFGHVVIGLAFIGPLRDPVRNKWVIVWGMLACLMVIPAALICGPIRGIPFYWRLIDCSFGVFGIVPLWLALRYTNRLEALQKG